LSVAPPLHLCPPRRIVSGSPFLPPLAIIPISPSHVPHILPPRFLPPIDNVPSPRHLHLEQIG
jgi:hypothetical protein